jgi:hypothetical protein
MASHIRLSGNKSRQGLGADAKKWDSWRIRILLVELDPIDLLDHIQDLISDIRLHFDTWVLAEVQDEVLRVLDQRLGNTDQVVVRTRLPNLTTFGGALDDLLRGDH